MRGKKLFFVLCLICLVAFCCTSKKNYLEIETTSLNTQGPLDQERQKVKSLERRMEESYQEQKRTLDELSLFKTRCAELENENQQLVNEMTELSSELRKNKSVIQLQGEVISLLDDPKQTIEKSLKEKLASENTRVEDNKGTQGLTFADMIVFDSGGAAINDSGKELLMKIAESVRENPNQRIEVRGHADDMPIASALKEKFPTNWELSAARAIAVVRFLHEECGLAPERLSARGFSYYRPIASNRTEEGRRQNRRIEIMLDSDN